MLRTVAICNPASGAGRLGSELEALKAQLPAVLGELSILVSERPGHTIELARAAVAGGARRLISLGGDGTHNEVLAGMCNARGELRDPECELWLLGGGRGNDLLRSLDAREYWRDALVEIRRRKTRALDYGIVHFAASEGGERRVRPFLNVCSAGLSSEIARRVARRRRFAYVRTALAVIRGHQPKRAIIQVDDDQPRECALNLCAAANGRFFGDGIEIAPEAALDDGQFQALVVHGRGRLALIGILLSVFEGRHLERRGVEHRHARRFALAAAGDATIPIEADGELLGRLPATITLAAGRVFVRA